MTSTIDRILPAIFVLVTTFSFSMSTGKCINDEEITYTTNSLEVTIEVHENTAKVIVPQYTDLRFSNRSDVNIDIYVRYMSESTNLEHFRLVIDSRSTLIPVKIPPPNNNSGQSSALTVKSQNDDRIFLQSASVVIAQFQDGQSSTIEFSVERCWDEVPISDLYPCFAETHPNPEATMDSDFVTFSIYDPYLLRDLTFLSHEIITEENNDVFIRFFIVNNGRHSINRSAKVKFYNSTDNVLDSEDFLLESNNLGPLGVGYQNPNHSDVFLDNHLYQNLIGQFIICQVDADDEIIETDEINNTLPIQLLSELEISDIRAYKRPDTNVILSSTITNTGNVPSEVSKLDFYVERYPRTFVSRGTIPSLQPGESYTVNSLVTWQYYSLVLHGRDLIVIADANNTVTEIDETNNEKIFRIPRNLGSSNNEQTYVTVAPNPYSSYIEFHYPVNYVNTDIKLSIYDQRGVLQYHTSKFHEETGNFKFKIYANEINNGINGIYYYSFLLGRFNTSYFPFTGTIIKQ